MTVPTVPWEDLHELGMWAFRDKWYNFVRFLLLFICSILVVYLSVQVFDSLVLFCDMKFNILHPISVILRFFVAPNSGRLHAEACKQLLDALTEYCYGRIY